MSLELEGIAVRKAYYKEYRKNNKDKIKNYNKTYWEKKAKEMQEGNND